MVENEKAERVRQRQMGEREELQRAMRRTNHFERDMEEERERQHTPIHRSDESRNNEGDTDLVEDRTRWTWRRWWKGGPEDAPIKNPMERWLDSTMHMPSNS